ncbi:phenylacetate--CoA ligase family protein [Hippea maritima]|uniref:Phenylacetate-coenzyme A ligase n=1 Tax=Hippea maritima (strain ATCC 700847 / DSM 10411 / MH2) TaxID=760142 RepID=F2LX68_HIPMA|nr:phenylacetate--CoA ligase [Hippea maritima]AEA33126.1 Phenylacetate--CoA ligase [Hippea maritima DSM 10411]
MFWEKDRETLDRKSLNQLQVELLREKIDYAYKNSPFYRRKFDECGITKETIQTIDDIQKLPFTTKTDFRDNYPFGLLTKPMKEIVRIHSSSGTTGKPTVVAYTRKDIETWSNLVARIAAAAGVNDEDVVQIAFGYGLFTGGFGLHYGLEKVGAAVIPASSGNTKRQVMIMKDFEATVLVCTPSYALYIGEVARNMGLDPKEDLKLRIGMFGAEPWSEQMRSKIETSLNIKAYDNYGLSEIIGPGVAGECEAQDGMHIAEDHFIVEIINPETDEPAKEGEYGEMVITTLTKEALPVFRYRTRDITRLIKGVCSCGRSFVRMEKPIGRTDDMLIIRGVNVFPSQIEEVLFNIDGISPHYQIIVDRVGALDTVTVMVEANANLFFDEMKKQKQLLDRINAELKTTLGLDVEVKLVEPNSIQRSEGKAKRIIDKRKF